ncbi:class II fumarate hydratase [Desulforhopalus singaporensis]|uniref:Fumarase, class II n=1 Tax=Desulforhopalus singaporensis TaxID=91360 RepID=A0A1H0U9T6_9BACT|nr:class II fumarate hydratase [Desulforhopalus singaporensis]SDP62933.1 fumarase, class II [Desulforhopalus singaporensis]
MGGAYRTELDSMGKIGVPVDALYGAQTQRAVENFTISKEPLPWIFIESLLYIKMGAAVANKAIGLISPKNGDLICQAVTGLLRDQPIAQFPVPILQTGSGTSTNMNVNEVITGAVRNAQVELSPNDHVNLGQSSNDVIPTAIHLSGCRLITGEILPSLANLAQQIRQLGKKHRHTVKTGRTHLMDALPIRLEDEVEAWALQLDECQERFKDLLKRLSEVPLGGTAVGSGVNCHPQFTEIALKEINARTGQNLRRASSSFKGQSSGDTFVEFSGHLKTCAVVLSKIANDLRLMNSGPLSGLAEIQLPALQPGSSIMPAKINPVIPEAVLMAAAQVIGNDTAVSVAGLGGNFQLNTMLPLIAAKLVESATLIATSAAVLGTKAIADIKVNSEVFDHALKYNPFLVTSLTPIIGYLKAAEIAKIAREEKRPVFDVALEQTDLDYDRLAELLDPARLAGDEAP